ncbi:MAG: permease [Firmicutes bacterium]|nr:permease [Bacillota bacterium]
MKERSKFLLILAGFLAAFYLPFSQPRVQGAILEAFYMLQEYARQHVLLCLVPAFFIAGAITVFVSQAAVMKYFGPKAKKVLAYSVASVSGSILAVCSCTVLPLFTGIYKRGAGLGPAIAFLYSGPAINVLAIILSARVLGLELGLARTVGAILFSIIIGLIMHFLFIKEETKKADETAMFNQEVEEKRPLWKTGVYFGLMIAILFFANWGKSPQEVGIWNAIFAAKWYITILLLAALGYVIIRWFDRDELKEWTGATWDYTKQILPLLLGGVLAAGFLLGRPGHEGIIPSEWVARLVGGNSIGANFFASISGALMYFATLTEIPILQGLIGSGMGKGPALALLLAGPSLSLPSMIVINKVLGPKKTAAYVLLVVIMATITGLIFGSLF